MNCNQVDNLLHDYIGGDLPEADVKAISEHHKTCSACNTVYKNVLQTRALLKEMPVPPHSDGFIDRVLDKAAENSNKKKHGIYAVFSGAIAAGFAIWFIVAGTLFSTSTEINNIANDVYTVMVGNEVQTIKVAIESERELSGVEMSIKLSPNLELAGFGNRTSIKWDTRLKKGVNVIKLPIVGLAAGEGEIITRIQMSGKEKIMRIHTNYQTPDNVWHQTNTTAKA